jgi:hypothetical protein
MSSGGGFIGGSTGGALLLSEAGTSRGDVASLAFDPPSVTIVIDSQTANKTATYKLKATLSDQTVQDVPAEALQIDRPDLASLAAGPPIVATASGTVAGTGTLHAVYGGLEATAKLIVQIVESQVTGNVPQGALDALGKDGLAKDPALTTLLYPYDGTVFPLGLNSPLMMWNAPNANGDVYRIHLAENGYSFDLYQVANAPAQVRVPQDAWDRVTASNGGDNLVLTVSRWDATANMAYSSVTENFTVAPESLRGAIYYWTVSGANNQRIGSITRIYPGSGAVPEKLNQGRCMGCHSVSADGSTLVATVEDPSAPSKSPYSNWTGVRAWASFTLPTAQLSLQTDKSGANSALTPNGQYVVFGGRANGTVPGSKYISLATTATGVVIPTSGLDDVMPSNNMGLMMPSFSVDGTKLALVEAGGDLSDNVIPSPSNRIIYLDFDIKVPKFDPTIHEVANVNAFPANDNQLGYPAFTPDGQWVAYHSGQYSTGCHDGCVDSSPDAGELWISSVNGGTPIRLARLDDPPAIKDHFVHREPTFCPVKRGGYSWVVFTSMRDWGNSLIGPIINGKRRLWVAAIDGTIGTTDPSHPAFYVEAQLDTPNMRGYWALAACIETPAPGMTGPMCKSNFECCSGFCVNGQCADKAMLSCVGVGQKCMTASQCCNQGATDCIDGMCKVGQVK